MNDIRPHVVSRRVTSDPAQDLLYQLVRAGPRAVLIELLDHPAGQVDAPGSFGGTAGDNSLSDELEPLVRTDIVQYDESTGTISRGDNFDLIEALVGELDRTGDDTDLEQERDYLALANESLRHGLLNGLNVVRARVQELPEAGDSNHREIVERRVNEMIGRVETIQAFTEQFVEGHGERKPVDVSRAVAEATDKLQRRNDEIALHVESIPDETVTADARLPIVFENVLRNAVEHNDHETPEIRVAGQAEDDRVSVRIEDDGPGMPDEEKEKFLTAGEKGVESEGTGFGLYFVTEAVDAYGGDLELEDRDPRGTRVHLELPRAD